jgi:hypothetical protein
MVRLCLNKIKGWWVAQPRRRFGASRADGRLRSCTRRQGDKDSCVETESVGGYRSLPEKEDGAGRRVAVRSGELWIGVLVEARLHG